MSSIQSNIPYSYKDRSSQTSRAPQVRPYTISIDFHCGCGFHTSSLEKAVEHCESAKHSIPVSGWIRYLRHIPQSKVAEVIKSQEAPESKFDDLRSKLSSLRST